MTRGTFNSKPHIRLGAKVAISVCLGELPVCLSASCLLCSLSGERVADALSIKHLLSSNGPLFPFQWSLRFHDTVYLADAQFKFASGIPKIHKKGGGGKKRKKISRFSFV